MIDLTIYGTPSSTYEYMKTLVQRQAMKAGIDVRLNEINNTSRFIKDNVLSIPAFKIGNELKTRNGGDLNTFVREVSFWLLKKENFGNMKKVLVPIDFSETSENAIDFAQKISNKLNGVIKLQHVYHPSPVEANELTYLDPEIESIKRKRLDTYASKLNETWIGDDSERPIIDKEFKKGLAADEIIAFSESEGDNMIVMGSTGSSGSLKNLFGSVSTKVARNAKCPVLLVPSKYKYKPIQHIAYMSEDAELDAIVMPKVIEMAKPFNAKISIIHCDDGREYDALKLLDMWTQFYPTDQIAIEIIKGCTRLEGINNFIGNQEVDLVAMSTQQRTVWSELFHDSLTKRMAINTTVPLYILHKK